MAKTSNIRLDAALWSWMNFARRHQSVVFVFWTVLTAVGLWLTVTLLGVNTDTSEMIDARAPYRVAQTEFEAAFPDMNDQVLVIVQAGSPDALDIYSGQLSEALRTNPFIKSVSHPPSNPFFQQNGLLYLETPELETQLARLTEAAPLIERLTLSPTIDTFFETLTQLAEQESPNAGAEALLSSVANTLESNSSGESRPLSWQSVFSSNSTDLNQTVIVIDPVLDHSRLRPAAPVQESIETIGQTVNQTTGIDAEIFITGNPVLRSDELKSVSQGIGLAFLISFIVVGFILLFALRSAILVFSVLMSLVMSIIITAGLAALIYGRLNLVSVAFTVLMVGLGVDFAIHLLMHLRRKRGEGVSVAAAFYRTSRGIGTALILTAVSTSLAFLAFVPTQFVGISQLGVVAAMGVIIAFLVATSLLPAAFSYFPMPKTHNSVVETGTASKPASYRRESGVASGVVILAFIALLLMPKAGFDADPMALRDQKASSVTAFNMLFDTEETVPYRLSVITESREAARDLGTELVELDTVDKTRSLLNFIPKDQLDKLDLIDYAAIGLEFAVAGEGTPDPIEGDPAADLMSALTESDLPSAGRMREVLTAWSAKLGEDPSLYARSEQDIFIYWPHQLDRLRKQITAREVTFETIPRSIKDRYESANGQSRVEIIPAEDVRDSASRRWFVTEVTREVPKVTGSARTVQDAGNIIQKSMLQAIVTALIAVSILLFLIVRNLKLVVIMLVPLLLAGVLTTATGVIFNLPYNFANVIVIPLLIGIGVDSSLHIALQAQQDSGSKRQSKSVSSNTTSRAVIFSAVTTIASFGSLSFSAHRGTASMGMLLMIAIIWVLICTLTVTPALIRWTSQKRDLK